jgi:hypothetical protein
MMMIAINYHMLQCKTVLQTLCNDKTSPSDIIIFKHLYIYMVKLTLPQAMEAHRVVRYQGSYIFIDNLLKYGGEVISVTC